MAYMVQFSPTGRFVRKARFNAAAWTIWAKQIPCGRIQLVVEK